VDGIIARGNLVYVAAETQTGKTLLGLYVAQRMLVGGDLFGKYPITPVQTVWYLVLEDPARRVQDRLLDVRKEFTGLEIARDRLQFRVIPGFALNNLKMMTWFELQLELSSPHPDVLFLDTYQKATPGLSSFDDPAQSRILHDLADLTRRRKLTMIVMDHVRKKPQSRGRPQSIGIDDIKGTGGKAQNADCVVLLERDRHERSDLYFSSYSKDFETPIRIKLRVAPKGFQEGLKFTYVEELTPPPVATARQRHGRPTTLSSDAVLQVLQPGSWMSGPAIAKACGASPATMRRRLKALAQAGAVFTNDREGKARRYRVING